MLFQDVVFWLLTVVAVGSALGVVLIRDLFRAALLLVAVFIAVGGYFVLLNAEFLAVVQVLIYAGAIAVLIIFAVMLTRDVQRGNQPNRLQVPAAILAGLLLAALVVVAVDTQWNFLPEDQRESVELVQTSAVSTIPAEALEEAGVTGAADQEAAQSAGLADLLIGRYVLPFEAVSVLLLAALIGALALVRPQAGPTGPSAGGPGSSSVPLPPGEV
jgi:NADH-quinone oxidoreductase subunit J